SRRSPRAKRRGLTACTKRILIRYRPLEACTSEDALRECPSSADLKATDKTKSCLPPYFWRHPRNVVSTQRRFFSTVTGSLWLAKSTGSPSDTILHGC